MNATLCNRDHPEYGVATIPLPIPDEEYAHCMELLEAMEIGSVSGHDCYVDQITEAPPSLDMLEGTMINVDELDFLARSLDRYTDEELFIQYRPGDGYRPGGGRPRRHSGNTIAVINKLVLAFRSNTL